MCCSSNQAAFAWIAAILVNLGFLSLISWGAATLWPLGCLLSAFYTCFLFGLANWLEQYESSSEEGANNDGEDDDNDDNNEEDRHDRHRDALEATGAALSRGASIANRSSPVLVSALYGLAVLSFGVTGFFLPVNLVETCHDSSSWDKSEFVWKTNYTALPKETQSWAKQNNIDTTGASFGYVESTGVTLFRGTGVYQGEPEECVWATSESSLEPPTQYRNYGYPGPFVTVTNNTVCFQATVTTHAARAFSPDKWELRHSLYCSDGKAFVKEKNSTSTPPGNLHSFKVFEENLWFKKELVTTYGRKSESGTLIYSLDPETMLVSLYSKRTQNTGNGGDSCDPEAVLRQQSCWALVTSAIPMTILSLGIWRAKSISSMGCLTYISLSLTYVALHLGVAPGSVENNDGPLFQWWFAISGTVCMILSSHLLLSQPRPERAPSLSPRIPNEKNIQCLRVGLQTSAVAFTYGMSSLIMFSSNEERDTLGWWVLLNLAVFLPLLILGAASNTTFLLVLGGLGFLADAARVAALADAEPLDVFLIFCFSGLLVAAMGYQVSRYQATVESAAKRLVQNINQWFLQWEFLLGIHGQEQLVEALDDTVNEPLVEGI